MHALMTFVLSLAALISSIAPFPITGLVLIAVLAAPALFGLRSLRIAAFTAAAAVFVWLPCVTETVTHVDIASREELAGLCGSLVDSLNAAGPQIVIPETALLLARNAMQAPAAPKSSRIPGLFRSLRIAGIFVPFTGEALIDCSRHPAAIPFTAAHELAHMRGVGDETAANIAAYRACIAAGGPMAYSARLWALKYAMHRADIPEYVYPALSPDIAAHLRAIPYSDAGPDKYSMLADWLCAQ